MPVKWTTKQMAGRAASMATIWGVSRMLSTPAGKRAANRVDKRVATAQASVKRGVRNARGNAGWAAAGMVALAAAAAFFGKATRR